MAKYRRPHTSERETQDFSRLKMTNTACKHQTFDFSLESPFQAAQSLLGLFVCLFVCFSSISRLSRPQLLPPKACQNYDTWLKLLFNLARRLGVMPRADLYGSGATRFITSLQTSSKSEFSALSSVSGQKVNKLPHSGSMWYVYTSFCTDGWDSALSFEWIFGVHNRECIPDIDSDS